MKHMISSSSRLVIGALLFAAPLGAQPRDVSTGQSFITLHVLKSGVFSVFADDHLIRAQVAKGTLDASGPLSVEIVIDPRQLQVLDPGQSADTREQIRVRMLGPEVLDVDRFPEIRFRSTRIQPAGQDRWAVEGELTLHGQTHTVSMAAQLKDGRYLGQSSVRQRDFGIRPITIAGGTVKVRDEIKIEFDIRQQ